LTGRPVRPVNRALARQGSLRVLSAFGLVRVLSAFGLGSNQWVLVQDPHPVNKKGALVAPFLFTGGGASLARRMLSGALPQYPVTPIRTDSPGCPKVP
jgi:hypothetical protein